MADQFVGEIRMFAGNFAPTGWALCNGQLIPISQNTALFSLLGTQYGGDGRTNFALPNLQGNFAIGQGQGPGLTSRVMGETGGSSTVTLLNTEMPAHTHTLSALTDPAESASPSGKALARGAGLTAYSTAAPNTVLSAAAVTQVGGSQPHNNMPPYLVMNYIIALQGIFPARG